MRSFRNSRSFARNSTQKLFENALENKFGTNDQRGLEKIARDKVNNDSQENSHLERGGCNWIHFAANFNISDSINITFVVHL